MKHSLSHESSEVTRVIAVTAVFLYGGTMAVSHGSLGTACQNTELEAGHKNSCWCEYPGA